MKPKITACNRYNNSCYRHLKHNQLAYSYKYKESAQHIIRYKLETWEKSATTEPFASTIWQQYSRSNTSCSAPHHKDWYCNLLTAKNT